MISTDTGVGYNITCETMAGDKQKKKDKDNCKAGSDNSKQANKLDGVSETSQYFASTTKDKEKSGSKDGQVQWEGSQNQREVENK